jgi:2-oxoglutarate/2-oxoacid ferredoxin oxidoreductase subunit alpha
MMEPIVIEKNKPEFVDKPWALTGCKDRKPNIVRSLLLGEGVLEAHNARLQAKYAEIKKNEILYEEYMTDDCDCLLVAYGTSARIARGAADIARDEGKRVGLLRPVSLWPFPTDAIHKLSQRVKKIITVELSAGQMIEDVQLAANGNCPVEFVGRTGGGIPSETTIIEKI